MSIEDTVRAVQRMLGVTVDGKAGPETWRAIAEKLGVPPPDASGTVLDERSERNVATLLPEVRAYARELARRARTVGVDIEIISGARTYAEQDLLYAQGRTMRGAIVTNVKGGESSHNFGIAFDVGVFEGEQYLLESPKYKVVGALGIELGLSWGGNWTSIHDEPHFELRPQWAKDMSEAKMMTGLRERAASGQPIYA